MNRDDDHFQDDLLDYAIIGARHMAHGLTDFPRWSKAMLAEGDQSILPFLRAIFDNAKRILKQAEEEFSEQPAPTGRESLEAERFKKELRAAEEQMDALLKQLFQDDNALQAEFAAEYKYNRANNPKFFDDPNWARKLEAQCRRDVHSPDRRKFLGRIDAMLNELADDNPDHGGGSQH